MSGEEAKSKFMHCREQVDNLEFSNDSIVELGAIKLEAERIAKSISNRAYSKFCVNELRELDTDEFDDMFTYKNAGAFDSAKYELMLILDDCIRGRLP